MAMSARPVSHANARMNFVAKPITVGTAVTGINPVGTTSWPTKSVEQGRFASLELTDTGLHRNALRDPRCKLTCFLGDRLSSSS